MLNFVIGALVMLFGMIFGFALAVSIANARNSEDD